MMSPAPIVSAGEAAGYYSNADNYYFLGQLESEWLGEGASALGLEGPVRSDQLTAVLEGRLPDGSRLGKEINGNQTHRPGHDLTFSAPKSVSILALIGGDKAMLEAHQHAVRVAAGYVEKLISARETVDGTTSIVPTGKMVAALYTHDTSRNLDPQLHTHMLVANMTELNGKWKALATDTIHKAGFIETVMSMQVTLGKLYRTALRERVEALGHEVETVGKHGMWEIRGVPEEVREEYSSRGREVRGAVGADATLKSLDIAAKNTRRAKVDPSRLRLMERWQNQMKEKGWDLKAYQDSVVPRNRPGSEQPLPPAQSEPQVNAPGTEKKTPVVAEAPLEEKTPPDGPARAGSERASPSPVNEGGKAARPECRQESAKAGPAVRATPPAIPAKMPAVADIRPEVAEAVRLAVSQLSDSKTRFTWGELLLSTTEFSDKIPQVAELKGALDAALKEGMIIPLDAEKGVFTSRNHLLDELSIQALSKDHLSEGHVVSFRRPERYAPPALQVVETDALILMNAPKGVAGIRELTEEIAGISASHGRSVHVLASSAERAGSLAKSDALREQIIGRQHVLSGEFRLAPQSTLIIEGAERLGLKETLVLMSEAREKSAQLIFLDSAGRQANGNAMSVLESAGVSRSRRTEPSPGLDAEVVSIRDKRDRYSALANRFAELNAGTEPVTAIVIGQREQKQLTGLIRDALQNAGQLERDGVTVEARTPVWLDNKTRRMPGSYRSGQVLEDRSERETRHYVIDRVHEDTRVLSLIDSDGVLVRHKIADLTADWRLYNSEKLHIAGGDKLIAVAADKGTGLKSKERLTVTGITENGITAVRDGKSLTLPADRPLYVTHGYVAGPGNRDNESGTVLAALNSRDITAQTMNSLAQSGSRAEIFTAEPEDRTEARLQRMRVENSPVQLVRKLSGQEDVTGAVTTLQGNVKSEAALAVQRAIADQQTVTFGELHLAEAASKFHSGLAEIGLEISAMVKNGDLIRVPGRTEPLLVARATWEMEKAIISAITEGKDTQQPLLERVDPTLLDRLTSGQKASALLVLSTRDQFTGIQGYAGVGKTTQVRAVKTALETLPVADRPVLQGLAPTHQAVKELRDVGLEAQTAKSFMVEHEQLTAAGEKPDYRNRVFLIDESSMLGNQDMAAAYQAIQAGGGRGVSIGDIDQFEAIESGAPFKLAQERSPMDVTIMKQIVRQTDLQLKNAVHDIIDNRIDAALRRLDMQPADKVSRQDAQYSAPGNGITETQTPVDEVVRDWVSRTPEARAQTMVIAQLNEDRAAINAGIYRTLAGRGELGREEITVPVLEKKAHTRHEYNRTAAWETGMVVKRGDAYQDVVAVDRNGSLITVKDENGRIGLYSPRELLTGDVELFTRSSRHVSAGTVIRFTATDRDRGQSANQKFTVEGVSQNGEIVLSGAEGRKVINPADVRAEQHIDYAWALTGYGSQGASSRYVISLEGTEGGRKYLATKRAFYISTSRAKEHVQVYTDGKTEWVKAIRSAETEIKTAHDALRPETERQQAKVIWAMGQNPGKTAIGRAWMKHESVGENRLTARVIPATKRFPDPSLALPLYDNNGKSAGLALISLVAGETGRLTRGEMRMVATQGATGAVLQRSRSGNTHVVSSVDAAMTTVRDFPEDGVIWQTGTEKPSPWMIKVSKGTVQVEETRTASAVTAVSDIIVPDITPQTKAEDPQNRGADTVASGIRQLQDAEGRSANAVRSEMKETVNDVRSTGTPDKDLLSGILEERKLQEQAQEKAAASVFRESGREADKLAEEKMVATKVSMELSAGQQEKERLPGGAFGKGQEIEHQEPVHTRTIQKER